MIRATLLCCTAFASAIIGAASCGSAPPDPRAPGQKGLDGDLQLDIHGPWADPETDYGRVDKAHTTDLTKATSNATAPTIVIKNATILTAAGKRFENGTLILEGGSITYVGDATDEIPDGATIIDAAGKFVTPGIIDTHSHIGVYASPSVGPHSDGNEAVAPVTAYARAEYGYFPQDPSITRARAGGVTTAQILPGSANLIGGQGLTIVMTPGNGVDEVMLPGAPRTMKMACGENPKRVYGQKGGPQTRMAMYSAFRTAFQEAAVYNATLTAYARDRALWEKKRARAAELEAEAVEAGKADARVAPLPAPVPPVRDENLEPLAAVLRGEVLVQIHCYRGDEILEMVKIADEFGFAIRSFHHALEAYKVRDVLVDHDIAISTWADWWGFKMEAFDGIPENAALFAEQGGRAVIHSDSSIGIQRLNQEAGKAMYSGIAAGINVTEDMALRWVTANPAWVLGIDSVTGTLETGKRADVVIWTESPFSVYTLADVVIQGGEIAYDRSVGLEPTDFELGNSELEPAAKTGGAK